MNLFMIEANTEKKMKWKGPVIKSFTKLWCVRLRVFAATTQSAIGAAKRWNHMRHAWTDTPKRPLVISGCRPEKEAMDDSERISRCVEDPNGCDVLEQWNEVTAIYTDGGIMRRAVAWKEDEGDRVEDPMEVPKDPKDWVECILEIRAIREDNGS